MSKQSATLNTSIAGEVKLEDKDKFITSFHEKLNNSERTSIAVVSQNAEMRIHQVIEVSKFFI